MLHLLVKLANLKKSNNSMTFYNFGFGASCNAKQSSSAFANAFANSCGFFETVDDFQDVMLKNANQVIVFRQVIPKTFTLQRFDLVELCKELLFRVLLFF